MDALLPLMIVFGVLAAVLGCFVWLALRIRRRGLAGGAMSAALASYEEAFHVTAHEAHYEIRAQAERKAPMLSPDGDWRRSRVETGRAGVEGGRSDRSHRSVRRARRGLARWVGRLRGGRTTTSA
ncbi:hypothetical protein SPAR_14728 [Streptomyces sparsogenes DSM 40356]|uniref:Secreted protein n=1 Tax=Streptomyces sparsogenes DSM 40356 TaxID=1331668 RepID=A0A1R1SK56_9ACTN|nr:hypothetical protein SPAR_14728 [Streptomyces sparsogenes DSM 40356]